VPKGFFPLQDTGVIQGISEAPQSVSFAAMAERQQALGAVLEDPAVESLSSFIGVDGTNTTLNSGAMLINLKPHRERDARAEVIARLQPAREVRGITLYMQPVQDLTIEDRVSRTQYQFTLETPTRTSSRLGARWSTACAAAAARGRRQRPAGPGPAGVSWTSTAIRGPARHHAAAIDNALYNAFGQRLISTIFTQSNQYRVVLEVKPSSAAGRGARDIYVATRRRTQVRLGIARGPERVGSRSLRSTTSAVPRDRSPSTSRPALARRAVKAIEARSGARHAGQRAHQLPGRGARVPSSLANTLLLILAAIVTMYIVLGVLYESYIHPVTILSTLPSAGVGALLALLLAARPRHRSRSSASSC
jgi:multidrug efflux pump